MSALAVILLGARVVSAILIMAGIRSLAARGRTARSARPGTIVAGVTLWILSELAAVPALQLVVASVPHWLWVGLLAASVSFAAVLGGTLYAVIRRRGGSTGPEAPVPTSSFYWPSAHQTSNSGVPS